MRGRNSWGKSILKYYNDFNCKKIAYRDRVEEAKSEFSKFYAMNRLVLSAYFRLLYRIMQTISEAQVDGCVKLSMPRFYVAF